MTVKKKQKSVISKIERKAIAPTYGALVHANKELESAVQDLTVQLQEAEDRANCKFTCIQEASDDELLNEVEKRCIAMVNIRLKQQPGKATPKWYIRCVNDESLATSLYNEFALYITKKYGGLDDPEEAFG